ncbi:hypothetical protein [Streptomyces sp. NPDC003077]|uniref:hypothetical protein n=1 Tax=Streptomyces sp. NPDC003077 TaxID=3154443 RepID=UPI0033A0EA9C
MDEDLVVGRVEGGPVTGQVVIGQVVVVEDRLDGADGVGGAPFEACFGLCDVLSGMREGLAHALVNAVDAVNVDVDAADAADRALVEACPVDRIDAGGGAATGHKGTPREVGGGGEPEFQPVTGQVSPPASSAGRPH